MTTSEPELSPIVARATGLRKGWTTGTCASAAAKAATIALLTGSPPEQVEVALPGGRRVSFEIAPAEVGTPLGTCVVVKDAGDDPDCTHGARITARVEWAPDRTEGVELRGGPGVGVVTKPGLGLEVGGPAINPVPRRMITQAIGEVTDRAVICTISVPGGEEMAKRTSNRRLGIVGGISILGTTGIVKPFSTSSWRASVVRQVDVAVAQGIEIIVLSTGSRTDAWAQRTWPELDLVSFIEVGDFTGVALRRAAGKGVRSVRFVGMPGKITKLAAGIMMTHFHRSKVDNPMLAAVAVETGSPDQVVRAATETATARHFFEVCLAQGSIEPLRRLCRMAAANCESHVSGKLAVEVVMIDLDGTKEICRG